MSDERTIILHYHLFKNAGTSVDAILKKNFADRWVTREFPTKGGNNTALVEDWIRETPEAIAYSSHTMMGPIPQVEGVRVISFMLLRDPIERIKSAYRFERNQQAETWGARLAKEHDFEGYVRARLARPGDRQCRNFQTKRLASIVPGPGDEIDRARIALDRLSIIGLVERFDDAVNALEVSVAEAYPRFSSPSIRTNTTSSSNHESDASLNNLLLNANSHDLDVLDTAKALIERH